MATTATPFKVAFSDEALRDLRTRLSLTRFPDQTPGEPWAYGTDLAYLKTLVTYWEREFDWRAQEAALNAYPQYRVKIGDTDLHYLHVPGKDPNATPLLLLHGWPGSVFEFVDILPLLTEDFTVIVASLPGYGLSFTPGMKRLAVPAMADLFDTLMTGVLGYSRYAVQGGDIGSFVATRLGHAYPKSVIGVHLNMLSVPRDRSSTSTPAATPEENHYFEELAKFQKEGAGYQWIQGTRPQTLAYGLTDSPAGLAAWIVEKFRAWSDCKGDVESAISKDHMLADISLYWLTGAIGSSFWPYYAGRHGELPMPKGGTVTVPTAYAEFPHEILRPPRSIAEKMYTNIQRWTPMPRGGHFAALEQPQLLAEDIRAFFKTIA